MLHKTDGSHTNRPFFRSLCRTCGKPPFLRKTSAPAVSFVSFLQEKKSFPFPFLFRKKGKKRKSNAEQLSFFAPAASVNMLHKTDGSHTNRPFFRSLCRTCGKPPFLRKTSAPAVSFVSFLQEKKTSPPFFKKRNRPPFSLPGEPHRMTARGWVCCLRCLP